MSCLLLTSVSKIEERRDEEPERRESESEERENIASENRQGELTPPGQPAASQSDLLKEFKRQEESPTKQSRHEEK